MSFIAPKLIVFDLNKTLIEDNSWLVLNTAMGVTEAEDAQLMVWGKEGIISDQQGQDILCSIYKNRSNPTREKILATLAKYTYLPYARETIDRLKENGITLALLSGSMDILVDQIAKDLNFDYWASNNHFIFDSNGVLQKIETIGNETSYKVQEINKIWKQTQILPSETWCIGDGESDLKLFEICRTSITFTGSPYSNQTSNTINSLKEILDLLR